MGKWCLGSLKLCGPSPSLSVNSVSQILCLGQASALRLTPSYPAHTCVLSSVDFWKNRVKKGPPPFFFNLGFGRATHQPINFCSWCHTELWNILEAPSQCQVCKQSRLDSAPPHPPNLRLPVKDGTVQYSVRCAEVEAGCCGSTDRGVTY